MTIKENKDLFGSFKDILEKAGVSSREDRLFTDWMEYVKTVDRLVDLGFELGNTRIHLCGTVTTLQLTVGRLSRSTTLRWYRNEKSMQNDLDNTREWLAKHGKISA